MSNAILDGRDVLDLMFEKMYPNSNIDTLVTPSRCTRPDNDPAERILVDIIQQKMETKPLPLAMRKRLMYEQSVAS